jgi:hypothetical protein
MNYSQPRRPVATVTILLSLALIQGCGGDDSVASGTAGNAIGSGGHAGTGSGGGGAAGGSTGGSGGSAAGAGGGAGSAVDAGSGSGGSGVGDDASTGSGGTPTADSGPASDALENDAELGVCDTADDCVFVSTLGCCGGCLAKGDPAPPREPICDIVCIEPVISCTCRDHRCAESVAQGL